MSTEAQSQPSVIADYDEVGTNFVKIPDVHNTSAVFGSRKKLVAALRRNNPPTQRRIVRLSGHQVSTTQNHRSRKYLRENKLHWTVSSKSSQNGGRPLT